MPCFYMKEISISVRSVLQKVVDSSISPSVDPECQRNHAKGRSTHPSQPYMHRTGSMDAHSLPKGRSPPTPSMPCSHKAEAQASRHREGQRQPRGCKIRRWRKLLRTIGRCGETLPLTTPLQTCEQCVRSDSKNEKNNTVPLLPPCKRL